MKERKKEREREREGERERERERERGIKKYSDKVMTGSNDIRKINQERSTYQNQSI